MTNKIFHLFGIQTLNSFCCDFQQQIRIKAPHRPEGKEFCLKIIWMLYAKHLNHSKK